jgi:hypothetical protein
MFCFWLHFVFNTLTRTFTQPYTFPITKTSYNLLIIFSLQELLVDLALVFLHHT